MILTAIFTTLIAAIIAFFVGSIYQKKIILKEQIKLQSTIDELLEKAKREAIEIKKEAELEAKEILFKAKQELDKEEREFRKELLQQEKRLLQKEESLDRKEEKLEKLEEDLEKKRKDYENMLERLEERDREFDLLKQKYMSEIERVASMTRNEAKDLLIQQMIDEAKIDSAKYLKEVEEETMRNAEKKARSIISSSIQRIAADYVGEIAVTVVNLPNDEMKGRIIGREGRNIRTFENVTGVDIIIDDTPEAVILSSYDPYRRAIAGLTLNKLIVDGRIHPARIEELYEKSKEIIDKEILEAGEEAVFELGLGNMNKNLIKLVGRLKYRTSYGQNILAHSIEVAKIAGHMAAELGVDVKMAKRAGLLHDIGKAADQDMEGSHTDLGYELARKYGEGDVVLNAIKSHHGEEDFRYIETVLVQAADAISASRPGARRESVETYIKRLEKLEAIASSFEGVAKTFAIQAGREIRIIVEPDKISDELATLLSKDISKRIEKELTYPGQIKVTVIRESRSVEYAK